MNIEIKWLEDFLVLCKTRNFSQAAQKRYVTQSAFSRRIQSLETQLGCKLVNRLYHPLRLTEQGECFQKTAEQTLMTLNQGIAQLAAVNQQAITLNFAATHTLSTGVFPKVLQYLNKVSLNLKSKLKVADADDCIRLLTQGDCDYLLAFSDPLLAAYAHDAILIEKVKLLPICKADKKGEPIYKLNESSTQIPYLAYQQNIYLGRVVKQLLAKHHQLNIKKTFESSMADNLKMMALQGLGVAWIPEFSIQEELQSQQLAICADKTFQPTLDVKLYRDKSYTEQHQKTKDIWQLLGEIQ